MSVGGVDRGSAGLLLVGVAVAVLAVAGGLAVWGGAVVARHRAGQAADLAALAAAGALARGLSPCPAAERVAAAVGARSERCLVAGDGSVLVVVRTPLPPAGRLAGVLMPPARARARAGRAEGVSGGAWWPPPHGP